VGPARDVSNVHADQWAGVDERVSWQERGCRDQLSSPGGPLPHRFTKSVLFAATADTPTCDCYVHQCGAIAAGRRTPHYPSDMTDAEWAQVRASMPYRPGRRAGADARGRTATVRWSMQCRYLVDRCGAAADVHRPPRPAQGLRLLLPLVTPRQMTTRADSGRSTRSRPTADSDRRPPSALCLCRWGRLRGSTSGT
jgi:hypothetical protein